MRDASRRAGTLITAWFVLRESVACPVRVLLVRNTNNGGNMKAYRAEALDILHTYPDTPACQAMEELVNYVIDRAY